MKILSYEIDIDDPAPAAGEHLVSIGKRGVNSIWLIKEVRKVKHKVVGEYQRYILQLDPAQQMKPLTVWDEPLNQLWVDGQAAHPLFWYPRGEIITE